MLFGSYNNMNMLGMNNMFGSNMFGSGNVVGSLFNGTGSIFDNSFSMFGGNMFGGGCSLFTNCNGTPNYSSMAGFGVGTTLLGIGKMALSSVIQDKKANSAETISQDLKGIQGLIKNKLNSLGSGVTESNFASHKAEDEDWYKEKLEKIEKDEKTQTEIEKQEKIADSCDTAIKNLKTKKDSATKKVNDLNTTISDLETQITNETNPTKKSALEQKLNTAKADKTAAEKEVAALEKQIQDEEDKKTAANNEIKKLKRTLSNTNIESSREKLDKETAIRQKAIDKTIDEIKELIDQRNNAQAKLNDANLNKADGTRLNRTSEENFNQLFDENGNIKPNSKVKKSSVRFAILGYRNAKTENEKQAWADKFKKLYNALSQEDQNDRNLSAAYGIICA